MSTFPWLIPDASLIPAPNVANAPGQIDHVADGLARLPQQWKDKPNIIALLTIFLQRYNDLEAVFWALLTQRGITGSIGAQLDTIGKIVGQPRNGLDDPTYQRYIYARVATNSSSGVVENLITVAKLVLNDGTTTITVNTMAIESIEVIITGNVVSDATAAILIGFLRSAKAGADKLTLRTQPALDADTFFAASTSFVSGAQTAGVLALPFNDVSQLPNSGKILVDVTPSFASSAGAQATAVGLGTWSAGYLCQDTAGTQLTAAFGGINIPGSADRYVQGHGDLLFAQQFQGPEGGSSGNGYVCASSASFDVASTTTDFIAGAALTIRSNSKDPTGGTRIVCKSTFGGGGGTVQFRWDASVPALIFEVYDASNNYSASAINVAYDTPYLVLCGIERATNKIIIGAIEINTGTQILGSPGAIAGGATFSSSAMFAVGKFSYNGNTVDLSALYLGVGVGNATGLVAGISTALSTWLASAYPNLELLQYVSRDLVGKKLNLVSATTKSHADQTMARLHPQFGKGYGAASDVGQPTLAGYSPTGFNGGQVSDARE